MPANQVKTDVTGAVWKIEKQVGEEIAAGDTIMIIESMKMEIPVISEDGGVVTEILVKPGDPVTEGDIVAVLGT